MNEYEFYLRCEERKKDIISELEDLKERYIVADILEEINLFKQNKNKRIFLFYGLRGIGKSTALYQVIKKNKDIMFIDGFDIDYNNIDLVKVVDEYKKNTNSNILIIDELNEIKNWGNTLKIIHDLYNIKIITTGSSAIKISKDISVIVRRSITKKINPLSFSEFLKLKYDINIDVTKDVLDLLFSNPKDVYIKSKEINSRVLKIDSDVLMHSKEYIKYGYPLALNKTNKIEDISENIIYKIIVDDFKEVSGFSVDTIEKAKKIIKYLASIKAGYVSYDKICSFAKLSMNPVSSILNAFFISDLLISVLVNKQVTSLRKEPKILFTSSAIRYGLMKRLTNNPDVGFLREDVFVSSLIYKDINVNYLKSKKKVPDYQISYKNKINFVEVGGPGKARAQLEKGILVLDDNKIDIKGDVVTIPLYLVCLI